MFSYFLKGIDANAAFQFTETSGRTFRLRAFLISVEIFQAYEKYAALRGDPFGFRVLASVNSQALSGNARLPYVSYDKSNGIERSF